MARERDVRAAIKDALERTGAFSSVWLTGLPEQYGQAASDLAAAAIEPESTAEADRYDAAPDTGSIATARLAITFLARHEDAQLRDELCENLVQHALNALNGRCLAGLTFPDMTRFTGWRWLPAAAPERRIAAAFSFSYPYFGWDSNDTTD